MSGNGEIAPAAVRIVSVDERSGVGIDRTEGGIQ